jgi:hypothetical protein
MVMTSVVICCHPETSGAGVTFIALSSYVEGSPSKLKQSFAALTVPFYTRREGILQMLL